MAPAYIWFERHSHNAALIAALALIVFSNALTNGFHQDDFYRVAGNPGIQTVFPVMRHFTDYHTASTLERIDQFRPMLPLTLSINYAIAGDSLVGYHLGNLLIDIIASILLYLLVVELLTHWSGRQWSQLQVRRLALLTGVLFAVHPVTGVLINYICGRDQLLMSMFALGALLVYVRMRRLGETPVRWCAAIVLAMASILSKADGAIIGAIVLLFELVLARSSWRSWRMYARLAPFVAVASSFFLYTHAVLHFSDMKTEMWVDQPEYVGYALSQARLHLFRYVRNFFWPFKMVWGDVDSIDKNNAQSVLIGIIFFASTIVLAWRVRRSNPLLAFCIAAYWFMIAPTSSIMPIIEIAKDYRPHPASPYLFFGLATVVAVWLRPSLRMPVALLVVAYVSIASAIINADWKDEATLWGKAVDQTGSALAHMNYAMGLPDRRDPRVRHHLEEAIRLGPEMVLGHINYGLLLIDLGDTVHGLAQCVEGVRIAPSWAQAHYWLSIADLKTGRMADAMSEAKEAARLEPGNALYKRWSANSIRDALLQHSLELYNAGRFEECIEECRRALALDPNYALAYNNICSAYIKLERWDEAIAAGEHAVALAPEWDLARNNLAYARNKNIK